MKFDRKPLQRDVAEIGYIAATRRFVPAISKLTRRDRIFGGGSRTQTSGPSPGLGADRGIQNDRESMWLASRNEHWPTLPSVGNQVNTAV